MQRILVIGATGNQGWAVGEALLKRKDQFRVRIFVRNPDSVGAKTLVSQGAEVHRGDLDDPETIRRALQGVDGVFCLTNFLGERGIRKGMPHIANFSYRGIDRERERGSRVAQMVHDMGIAHLVYSGMARIEGLPSTEGKAAVEDFLKTLPWKEGVSRYTIVHPVSFMRNFEETRPESLAYAAYRAAFGTKRFQWLDLEDFGECVAHIFTTPHPYYEKTVQIWSDELTYEELEKAYRKVYGRSPLSGFWQAVPTSLMKASFPFLGHVGKVLAGVDQIENGLQSSKDILEHASSPTTFIDWLRKRERKVRQMKEFRTKRTSPEELIRLAGESKGIHKRWTLLTIAKELNQR